MSISIPTDPEHWKLPAVTAGFALQAQGGYIQFHSDSMFLSLGYIQTLVTDTVNEIAAESTCELSIHVPLKGGHLSAH